MENKKAVLELFERVFDMGRLRGAFGLLDLSNLHRISLKLKEDFEETLKDTNILAIIEDALNKVSRSGALTFADSSLVLENFQAVVKYSNELKKKEADEKNDK